MQPGKAGIAHIAIQEMVRRNLTEVGVYYANHNHSVQGYVPAPKATPTPEPVKEIEIGVHMTTWDVGLIGLAIILLVLAIVYVIRL